MLSKYLFLSLRSFSVLLRLERNEGIASSRAGTKLNITTGVKYNHRPPFLMPIMHNKGTI